MKTVNNNHSTMLIHRLKSTYKIELLLTSPPMACQILNKGTKSVKIINTIKVKESSPEAQSWQDLHLLLYYNI